MLKLVDQFYEGVFTPFGTKIIITCSVITFIYQRLGIMMVGAMMGMPMISQYYPVLPVRIAMSSPSLLPNRMRKLQRNLVSI